MRKQIAVLGRSCGTRRCYRQNFLLTIVAIFIATSRLVASVVFTNDLTIGLADKSYEGQDVVVSNCVLAVDGEHIFAGLRVAGSGTLTHSASDDGLVADFIPAIEELHVLTDTNPVVLVNSNVFTGAMLVTDTNATIFYQSGADYVTGSAGDGFTTLQRATNSTIPDGGSVLVSYFYVGFASAGLNLIVTGNFQVEAGAKILADGRGFGAGQGPGAGSSGGGIGAGAGHGGNGGLSASTSAGGVAYDSAFEPVELGSAGGSGIGGNGGSGGGAMRFVVSNAFVLDGIISANGSNATNSRAGGGAGGSVWISAHTFSGSGAVTANGGAGEPVLGGGGAGGRIAIQFETNSFSGTITAFGATGAQRGGAGTVFLQTNGTGGRLIFDNGNISGARTPLSESSDADFIVQGRAIAAISGAAVAGSLIVRSNSSLVTTATNNSTLVLTIMGDATVEKGATIPMDGKGYSPNTGPGAGVVSSIVGSGAGHGGYGGGGISGTTVASGGNYYDSMTAPSQWGSGGRGPSSSLFYIGGSGGGVVRMIVSGNLQLDGEISADANSGSGSLAGGGSGGSVYLTVNGGFSGSGLISANGGSGGTFGGGGAGGRIAIYYSSNNFVGSITASGGNGAMAGGAGTVFTKAGSQTYGNLRVNNGGLRGTNTVLDAVSSLIDLTVDGGAILRSTFTSFTVSNLLVGSNSALLAGGTSQSTLTVSGNANIAAGGTISADGLGYVGTGPGVGATSTGGSGGGGHGGYGGLGAGIIQVRGNGGNYYDLIFSPTQGGSSGGGGSLIAGNGGGALRLNMKTLTLDGRLSANGLNAFSNNAGGGSGGSLYLSVGELLGAGQISADGGSGHLPNGGGGAGGRIAIYYTSNSFTGTISAKGGAGFGNGGAGTIYIGRSGGSVGSDILIVDNGGLSGTNTVVDSTISRSLNTLTIAGGARVNYTGSSLTLSNLTITTNSAFLSSILTLTLTMSNANVAAGAIISSDGLSSSGSGIGGSSFNGSGGGGYGGYGGRGAGAAGGNAYGSVSAPTATGSPGGYNNFPPNYGGAALRMTVSGQFNLDGKISANGAGTATNGAGGGSGGSIYLTAGRWSGAGSISADGGSGHLPNGGGGGGGRIALYYTSNSFTGTITAKGGTGFTSGGAGTIYVKKNISQLPADVVIDNAGQLGMNTTFGTDSSISGFNLNVTGGGNLRLTSSLSLNNLVIGANSTITASVPTLTLTVTSNANIAAGGMIVVDGAGGSSGQGVGGTSSSGSGGGSHAGYGGRGLGAFGGRPYDSASSPTLTGSGGGGSSFAGAGGGFLRMTVNGSLMLNGKISANGLNTVSNNAGGGSGGTVYLTVGNPASSATGTFSGSGIISADGGSGHLPNGGGGGGGRIAVAFSSSRSFTNLFTGTISAKGGAGFVAGGAGTVYLNTTTNKLPGIFVDNGGVRGTNTSISASGVFDLTVQGGANVSASIGTPHDVLVRSNGFISQAGAWSVSRNATFEQGSAIILDGFGSNSLASGASFPATKGGAGHGGYGGNNPAGWGATYDSTISPTLAGGVGGNGSGSSLAPLGGRGGEAVHLTVGGTLTLHGDISANGTDGDVNSGGGSGGSIWLQSQTFAGDGNISARGGGGNGSAGGGAGGRIAIYYTTNLFTGAIFACGGNSSVPGGAGTIYLKANGQPNSSLLVDNCGLFGTNTPLSQSFGLGTDLNVSGGAVGEFQSGIPLFSNVTVSGNAMLTASIPGIYLSVAHDLNIGTGSALSLDGQGFAQLSGPGAGSVVTSKGSGGGYGGVGGASLSGATGGATYGSAAEPVDAGSGGGVGYARLPLKGSQGGGAMRLFVGGALNVDGNVTVNGNAGVEDDSGGGSGGSIWATAGKISGSGLIAAEGGEGDLFGGGGGGGGRIALYSPMNNFTGTVSVAGGFGAFFGGEGTIFTSSTVAGPTVIAQSPTGVVSNLLSQLTFDFNQPLNPASLDAGDVKVIAPTGMLAQSSIGLSVNGLSTLRVMFPPQFDSGEYRVEVGPGVENLIGEPMSQVYTGFVSLPLMIVGSIKDANGNPVFGTLIQSDSDTSTVVDENGVYALSVPSGWSGTVSASFPGLFCLPGLRSYTNVTATIADQDFVMVANLAPSLHAQRSGASLALTWNCISNVTYQVYSSTNLSHWTPFGDAVAGTNGAVQLLLPITDEPERFFRLGARN